MAKDNDGTFEDAILETFQAMTDSDEEGIPEEEVIEVPFYPVEPDDTPGSSYDEIESIVKAAQEHLSEQHSHSNEQIGYVSNARNAMSKSDTFSFWAPAEDGSVGIGSLVRHTANDLQVDRETCTYAIITGTEGVTAGLDDYVIHVYEEDAQPPLTSIVPAPSQRRPVINYEAKVLASNQQLHRPVASGPVYPVKANELAGVHNHDEANWPGADNLLLGFYQDGDGEFGIFAEERERVLGPKQGHVIFSGLPGAGKTSLFLTLVISLYAHLADLESEGENIDEK